MRMWKEVVMAYFKVLSWHSPDQTRKTTEQPSQDPW